MSITTTHVTNFRLRLQLLIWGLIIGAALGGWVGHKYVHAEMSPRESQAFQQYLAGRAKEIIGLDKLAGQSKSDRHIQLLYELRATQEGNWGQEFDTAARQAYIQFPIGGAIGMAILVMLIGRRIGDVSGSDAK